MSNEKLHYILVDNYISVLDIMYMKRVERKHNSYSLIYWGKKWQRGKLDHATLFATFVLLTITIERILTVWSIAINKMNEVIEFLVATTKFQSCLVNTSLRLINLECIVFHVSRFMFWLLNLSVYLFARVQCF